jgi:hypothetical protein
MNRCTGSLILGIFILISFNLVFAEDTISTYPEKGVVRNIKQLKGISKDFIEFRDHTYGLFIKVKYRRNTAPQTKMRMKSFIFQLEEGVIVKRNGALYLQLDGEEVEVATGKWWQSPRWTLTDNVDVNLDLVWPTRTDLELSADLVVK